MSRKRKYLKRRNRTQRKPHQHKTKKFKKVNCSPTQKKRYTCYSNKSLKRLKTLWNSRHPDSKIKAKNDREIWERLKNNFSNVCNEEKCWLRQNFIKNKLSPQMVNYTFSPDSPKEWRDDINTWLSSTDIENVMHQYEKKYPNFSFLGPSPIDFDTKKKFGQCVWNEICKFQLNNFIKKGKNKIGIIFNLDKHWQPGSHWVSLFIDINKGFVFYFDSAGEDIPKQVKTLCDRIINQGGEHKPPITLSLDKNYPFEHQYGTSECGIYCLYFIITLLTTNTPVGQFKNKRVSDKDMENLRSKYFNIHK